MTTPEHMGSTLSAAGIEFTLHGSSHRARWDVGGRPATEYTESFDSGISAVTRLDVDRATGVIRRSDRLTNTSGTTIEINDPTLCFDFTGNGLSITAQSNTWGREAQRVVLDLAPGKTTIGSKGRSCSGYVPHFVVSSSDIDTVIDLLPTGDWRAGFCISPDGGTLQVRIDRFAGVSLTLRPGQCLDLALESLICHNEKGREAESARAVQTYAMDRINRRGGDVLPVVYNTWFDLYHKITWDNLEAQLSAAAEVGCEVFVIDAGWYGPRTEDWIAVGDWRENPHVFSDRPLIDFAELVRSRGMQFGIWMEPERVHPSAPSRIEHPEWFVVSDSGMYYPDLSVPEARDWVFSEMARVVEAYGVKWLKVDCNFDFSDDPRHTGHADRMRVWYGILDEIAGRFPDLVLEGCASGGLRNDLLTVSHFHTHFLSDNVEPVDIIRIGMSGLCRLAPRMTTKWAVVYPAGGESTQNNNTGDLVLCLAPTEGDRLSSYHLDFAMYAAMTGVLGISGSIAGLSPDLKSQLAGHIEFYKAHREFIQSAVGIALTPVEPLTNREGLAAIQLSDRDFVRNMIFVYNISLSEETHTVRPVGLNPDANYRITDEHDGAVYDSVKGSQLLDGWEVECGSRRSRVIILEKATD